ncbi:GNAT family N-acetyltransferase [Ferrovibrio sp. MS7]|jgi:ribosomal-protein-alanine N-acetyltransferase|uniref:GNAT family N-acetyltransferase n=1 Tax=Ferrovibrio plantarum TaxID=3119164 RepID=UPI003135A457
MTGPVAAKSVSGLGKSAAAGKPHLRPATAADLDALVALEETCFATDRFSRRSYARALASPRAHLRVMETGGRLAAAGLIFTRADTAAARLYSIAVHPDWRGQGLARRLLTALEQTARKIGADEMRLEVADRNKAALALYRESGYEETGRLRRYYQDGADALRLTKRLAARS